MLPSSLECFLCSEAIFWRLGFRGVFFPEAACRRRQRFSDGGPDYFRHVGGGFSAYNDSSCNQRQLDACEYVIVEEQTNSQEEEVHAVNQSNESEVEKSVSTTVEANKANLPADKTEENTMSLVEDERNTLKDMEWSDVSPGKSSRSPRKTSEIEKLMTSSRFSVLSQTEEEGEEMEENGNKMWLS
ncbi:hypothetical protein DY000_02025867 [Brassica cretica]|uniref:Uncharacterized protein n=1 Tax=Brassica cretica TaxID=69181 RepID=A0ABQ7E800_BRACR|nr:hypothetical protein DY000_02025867 [Brassica cretica]